MTQQEDRQSQVEKVVLPMTLPPGVSLRAWTEDDFSAIQRLSNAEGWPTPQRRPDEALSGWRNSWPTLVAVEGDRVIGFVRAFTDGSITMYVMELLIDVDYRGRGIGGLLLDTCHYLYPRTRIEVMPGETSQSFYASCGFRRIGQGFRKSYV